MKDGVPDTREARALLEARALVSRLAAEGRHHVAAAVLTEGGLYTGISLESTLPRASVCAEAAAISAACAAEPGARIVHSVAVNRRGEVIPPCGPCRELLADFGPSAQVAVAEDETAPLCDLLPRAYKGHLRFGG